MSGKGRISPKRPRDRLSSWLRRRHVRTDDAVHRPREMRRSRQLKAVGSGGSPDNSAFGLKIAPMAKISNRNTCAPTAIIPARAPRRRLVNAINPPDRPRISICAPQGTAVNLNSEPCDWVVRPTNSGAGSRGCGILWPEQRSRRGSIAWRSATRETSLPPRISIG
jgi:hypothetical protein